jgi:hypothetical protein
MRGDNFPGARLIAVPCADAHLDGAIPIAAFVWSADASDAQGKTSTPQTPPARAGARRHDRHASRAP